MSLRSTAVRPLTDTVRVVIANQDPVLRRGLRCVIEEHDVGRVVAEVRTQREAMEATIRLRPDVLLLGLPTALNDGLKILPVVARLSRVLVLTHNADAVATMQAMRRGAAGCLVHGEFSVDDLLRAVSGARGRRPRGSGSPSLAPCPVVTEPRPKLHGAVTGVRDQLSPREAEVMDRVAEGMDNGEIARRLVLSEKTVKNHINRIFAKLAVRNRAQAIVLWLRCGTPAIVGTETGPLMERASA